MDEPVPSVRLNNQPLLQLKVGLPVPVSRIKLAVGVLPASGFVVDGKSLSVAVMLVLMDVCLSMERLFHISFVDMSISLEYFAAAMRALNSRGVAETSFGE